MEATGEANIGSLLDKIRPPRLEDAGLEDCALAPDSIQEAFLKAATAVRTHIFSPSNDEPEGDCVEDPWPGAEYSDDKLVGNTTEAEPTQPCAPKKGGELPEATGDDVVTGGREKTADKVIEPEMPEDAGKSCVEGLQGLKIGEKKEGSIAIEGKKSETDAKANEDEEDGEKPKLAEVCI